MPGEYLPVLDSCHLLVNVLRARIYVLFGPACSSICLQAAIQFHFFVAHWYLNHCKRCVATYLVAQIYLYVFSDSNMLHYGTVPVPGYAWNIFLVLLPGCSNLISVGGVSDRCLANAGNTNLISVGGRVDSLQAKAQFLANSTIITFVEYIFIASCILKWICSTKPHNSMFTANPYVTDFGSPLLDSCHMTIAELRPYMLACRVFCVASMKLHRLKMNPSLVVYILNEI